MTENNLLFKLAVSVKQCCDLSMHYQHKLMNFGRLNSRALFTCHDHTWNATLN